MLTTSRDCVFGPLFPGMPKSYACIFLLGSISDQKPLISTERNNFYLSVVEATILSHSSCSHWEKCHITYHRNQVMTKTKQKAEEIWGLFPVCTMTIPWIILIFISLCAPLWPDFTLIISLLLLTRVLVSYLKFGGLLKVQKICIIFTASDSLCPYQYIFVQNTSKVFQIQQIRPIPTTTSLV